MVGQASDQDHYFVGVDRTALRRYELFNKICQPATEMRLATLPVKPNARVVDFGCGIGRTAIYFAEAVVPDGHVVGLDESEELIALARHFAAEQGFDNITFRWAGRKTMRSNRQHSTWHTPGLYSPTRHSPPKSSN